jgi:hypothetical protein
MYSNEQSAEDRLWKDINRSQRHERRNWILGHAVSFLGKYVSNFRYNV